MNEVVSIAVVNDESSYFCPCRYLSVCLSVYMYACVFVCLFALRRLCERTTNLFALLMIFSYAAANAFEVV